MDRTRPRSAVHPRGARTGGLRLVFGASGYIGSNLAPWLGARGYRVRAAARRAQMLPARRWRRIEVCRADALAPASLAAALDGVEVAYYLVHSMAAGRGFGALDERAAENFRAAAAAAGVRRIVYLGGLLPQGAHSEHLVSRARTGERLRQGPVAVTEIRAGIVVGAGSAAFETMRDAALHLPVVLGPAAMRARTTPIALDNLLEYLARAPELDATADAILDAGGPEDISYAAMVRGIATALGRRPPPVVGLAVLPPRLSARGLPLITSVPFNVARALIEGMSGELTTDDLRLRELVPQELLGYQDSVRAVFRAERQQTRCTRWVEGAFSMRANRHDYAYYAKRASGSHTTRAAPDRVWAVLSAIGGRNRYYYLNGLWALREVLDWMAGGPGLERGRRDPARLDVGDPVDSWTVIGVEPERRLTLSFGMKAPGAGVLEFELEPRADGGSRLTATAYWHPAGVWGLLYWYPLAPFHRLIFEGMTREICERAERR